MYLSKFIASSCCLAMATAVKPVFIHYMVGGFNGAGDTPSADDQAKADIKGAMTMGADAFALNIGSWSAPWSLEALDSLFRVSDELGFKLFFSVDTYATSDSTEWINGIKNWTSHGAYYQYDSKPFVSTFSGQSLTFGQSSPNQGWQTQFKDKLDSIYFVPNFEGNVWDDFSVADGLFGWETAWPEVSQGSVNVSSATDLKVMQSRPRGKTYMMPLSTYQYKHIAEGQNWMRIGELNLPMRMEQILQANPDFVEILTWNDVGEGHYMGTYWPSQIGNNPLATYSHVDWQQVMTPFITAFKAGDTSSAAILPNSTEPQGAMWYRPLSLSATCSDPLARPDGYENGEDAINYAVLLPEGTTATINVWTGSTLLQTVTGKPGLNYGSYTGLQTGVQGVEVVDNGIVIVRALSNVDFSSNCEQNLYNWNYNVVSFGKAI